MTLPFPTAFVYEPMPDGGSEGSSNGWPFSPMPRVLIGERAIGVCRDLSRIQFSPNSNKAAATAECSSRRRGPWIAPLFSEAMVNQTIDVG
jgi:hypothetical protein